jgi:hypothetical protein
VNRAAFRNQTLEMTMYVHAKNLVLVGLLAALPTSIAAQSTEAPAQTTQPANPTRSTEQVAPTDPGAAMTEAAPAPDAVAAPVEGQIVLQSEDSILAKDFIGARVYSSGDETVGEINDLIVNLDGTIEGVVIGVGGFLGIGEKDVAVEMAAITVATDPETGSVRLVLGATREDLDAAPAFKTADEQKMEQEMQTLQSNPGALAPAAPADATTAGN